MIAEDVVEGLGAGKRPAVRVTINGSTYRGTVATMDGRFNHRGQRRESRWRPGFPLLQQPELARLLNRGREDG